MRDGWLKKGLSSKWLPNRAVEIDMRVSILECICKDAEHFLGRVLCKPHTWSSLPEKMLENEMSDCTELQQINLPRGR